MFKYLLLLLTLITATNANSQQAALHWKEVAQNHNAMGMAVLGWCADTYDELYYGKRDFERDLPLNENTMFRLASTSKLVTSMAVLWLYDQELLDLDQPISEYLNFTPANPDYPGYDITIRMLLTHTSSIQDGDSYMDFLLDSYNLDSPPSISEILLPEGLYFSPNIWRLEPPGSYFAYSNLNFGILGSVIESVTQQRFDKWMFNDFLPKLSIPGSFNPSDIENIDDVAVLYRKQNSIWQPQLDNFQGIQPPGRDLSGYQPGDNGLLFAPQGGLRTTAQGLLQVARVILNNGWMDEVQILSDNALNLIIHPHWVYNGSNGDNYFGLYYAFSAGAHITTNRPGKDIVVQGYPMVGHPGAAYGLASSLYMNPDKNAAIVFITNGVASGFGVDNRSSFYTIETDIFEIYSESIFSVCESDDDEGTRVSDRYEPSDTPFITQLKPNYPNPFNPATQIQFITSEFSMVNITVYNMAGKLVRTIWDSKTTPGTYTIHFDAQGLSSGIYLIRLQTNETVLTQKITLIK